MAEAGALDVEGIASAFTRARRSWENLPDYPGSKPRTLAEGYGIQDAAIAAAGRTIAGWKLGRINLPGYGSNRLAGPIFPDLVIEAGNTAPVAPVFAGGFAAAEAEFILRTSAPPPAGQERFSIEEARALVADVLVGIEIASSPYPNINEDGPAVTVSDFGNNNGLILGAAVSDWRSVDLDSWPVELEIDGESIGTGTTATMLDGPFGSLRFLLEHLAQRGIGLPAGSLISTGAITGVHPVKPGQRIEARFGDTYRLGCIIEAGRA